ncbi:MAG: hypothetical protein RL481_2430 [Pseudomonadota bacterium]|jgi:carboxymethylenebutenolidase
MCDQDSEADLAALSRRQLGMIAGSLGLAASFPAHAANALAVVEKRVEVKTPDGIADCLFTAPAKGRHPGVIVWPDIWGVRPAFAQMGRRLAESGYAVLTVNPFYRSGKAPTSPIGVRDEAARAKIGEMRKLLTPDAIERDATAFVAFLDKQKIVDRKRKIGTTGYCMGGNLIMRTAAAVPARVGAAASFHGSALATDAADSPHRLIPKMKASFLFAVAAKDDERNPAEKDRLRAAYAAANLSAEIEVYADTLHGWCVPDGQAYNAPQADRAWERLLALFGAALA